MMKPRNKIYFRADGNAEMGLGHVVRSLALAEILSGEFECHFIIRNPLPVLREQIFQVCASTIELPETGDDVAEARKLTEKYFTGDEIIVLDGYHFRTQYQKAIKGAGCKLVCIDDIHDYHFVADVVINHAPGVEEAYQQIISSNTQLYTGLKYALVRPAFRRVKLANSRSGGDAKSIFICFGGSDIKNLSLKVLKNLVRTENNWIMHLVLGDAYYHNEDLEAFIKTAYPEGLNLYRGISASKMAELMNISDIAVVPSSSVLYEVCTVNTPAISGYYIDNQVRIYEGFLEEGLIKGVGDMNLFDEYDRIISEMTEQEKCRLITSQRQSFKGDHYLKQIFNQLTNERIKNPGAGRQS